MVEGINEAPIRRDAGGARREGMMVGARVVSSCCRSNRTSGWKPEVGWEISRGRFYPYTTHTAAATARDMGEGSTTGGSASLSTQNVLFLGLR